MSTTKKLVLIVVGYGISIVGGLAAVALNEAFMSEEISQTSGGMVAFGDVVLFLLVAGFLALVPTWFLLVLAVAKAPRVLLAAELLAAVIGPVSWLAVRYEASGPVPATLPHAELLGPLIALIVIPRIVIGPVLLVIEGATFFLMRANAARAILAAAMLMDLVPLGLFALHVARMVRYSASAIGARAGSAALIAEIFFP